MKKIISLVFVVIMLFACTMPAYAEDFSGRNDIIEDTIYESFNLDKGADVYINHCNVEITEALSFFGYCTLNVSPNASLTGENLIFNIFGDDNVIRTHDGFINLSFMYYGDANRFEQLLKDNDIDYNRDGNHIVAGCPHSEWEDGVCTRCGIHCLHETYDNGACTVCGKACENEFHNGKYTCPDCGMVADTTATGSILSHGYPEIVYGIGGLAVGFLVAMFIFRKKKVAVSSTSTDDEE